MIGHADKGHDDVGPVRTDGLRLANRLYGFVRIRYLVSTGIVVGALSAAPVAGIEGLDVRSLIALAVVLALWNTGVFFLLLPYRRHPDRAIESRRLLVGIMHFTISADFLCLTVALWLAGGAQSPFQAFFIFHVIVASVLLSERAAYAHALMGYVLLAGLVVGSWRGWIPAHYPQGAVPTGGSVDGRFVSTILVVQGLLFISTAVLTTSLMRVLRAHERRLVEANIELERLSNVRKDFLQIAMHNLRSPVGAVTMLLQNLEDGYLGAVTKEQVDWLERAQKRLKELFSFLHDLQFLAALETGQSRDQSELVDVRAILADLVDENQDLALAHGHSLTLDAEQELTVKGIPRLLREALVNFVTNAIKYTPDGGTIVVRGARRGPMVRVEVEDNGIGIASEDRARLFQEFVRLERKDAQLTNVAGTGLGLFISKRIIEAQGGRVDVISELHRGSTFIAELPASD